jgi:hypothetical protein
MKVPFDKYRPTRTDDGQGGYTEALSGPDTIWAMMDFYENEEVAYVDEREDVEVGDILLVVEGD